MPNNSTPMDYGEAVWRTAEIRMHLDDIRASLDALPPFARHFALQAVITNVEEALKDFPPSDKAAVIRMFRSWEKM